MIEIETILVVDDHPVVQDGLELMLQELRPNAEIIPVLNATEALQYAMSHKELDWIFVDVNLPDYSGLELITQLREQKILSNVVILSSEILPHILEEALKLNVNGVLSKAFYHQDFVDCFATIENGQVFLTVEHANELKFYRQSQLLDKNHIEKKISSRQVETLLMVAKGYSNREIASSMQITESTVKSHVSGLMELFNADNRTHCVCEAQRLKII